MSLWTTVCSPIAASANSSSILAKALIEKDTSFAVVLVEPNGRVWFRYRLDADVWAWHPDAPKAGAR